MIADIAFVGHTAMTPNFSKFSSVETEHKRFDYFLRNMFLTCDKNVSEITHSNSANPSYEELFREVTHQCITLRDRRKNPDGGGIGHPDYESMFATAKYRDFLLLQPILFFEFVRTRTTRMLLVVHFPPIMKRCSCRKQRGREESGSRFSATDTSPKLYLIYTDSDDCLQGAPSAEMSAAAHSLTFQQWLRLNKHVTSQIFDH
jgi:hypothetical protein